MNPETRAVVDAVIEALDIPYAATVGHEETRQTILDERIRHLVVCMRGMVGPDPEPEWRLAYLRDKLAEHPATGYVTIDQAQERVAQGASWSEAVRLPDENSGE